MKLSSLLKKPLPTIFSGWWGWAVAAWFALYSWFAEVNTAGFIAIKRPGVEYLYYFGFPSSVWSFLAAIFICLTWTRFIDNYRLWKNRTIQAQVRLQDPNKPVRPSLVLEEKQDERIPDKPDSESLR